MKRTTKITVILLLVFAMMLPATLSLFAAKPRTVQPRWTSIATIELTLIFSGTEGNAGAVARKQSTATNLEGTLTVYKQVGNDWVFVADTYGQKPVGSLGLSVDFTGEIGVLYKAVFEVTAYTGNVGETEIVDCTELCD